MREFVQGICVFLFAAGGSVGVVSIAYMVLSTVLADPDIWVSGKVAACALAVAFFALIVGAVTEGTRE